MDTKEMAGLLANINIFSGLEREDLERLAEQFQLVTIPGGIVILNEGDRGTDLNIVLQGQVDIYLPSDTARSERFAEIHLARMGPGELFGEYALIDMRPASASVRTAEACQLLRIEYEQLHHLINQHAALGRQFYANLLLVLIDRLRKDDSELDLFAFAGA